MQFAQLYLMEPILNRFHCPNNKKIIKISYNQNQTKNYNFWNLKIQKEQKTKYQAQKNSIFYFVVNFHFILDFKNQVRKILFLFY